MTYYIEIIIDLSLIIFGIISASPSFSVIGCFLLTLSFISKHIANENKKSIDLKEQLQQITPNLSNKISDYFCISIEISQKGDYRPLIQSNDYEKFSKILEKKLKSLMGNTPVIKISSNRFIIIEKFPDSKNQEIPKQTAHQENRTKEISDFISKIITEYNSTNILLTKSTIGTATSGYHYQTKTIEELIELAHFTLVIAKQRNLPYLIADSIIRYNMQDFFEFKQAFESKETLSEFTPYFQPIIDLDLKKVIGCEVFARWHKDSYRVIEASRFKDIAYEMNLMEKIDKTIIKQTFKSVSNLKQQQVIPDYFFIVINVSAMTIISTSLPDILKLAEESNIKPEQIEFDIKDKNLSNNIYKEKLNEFRAAGFRIALDVFDEENFDMHALLLQHFNTIKIDFSLLDEESDSTKNKLHLYDLLVNLTEYLKIKLLAKNIQNKHQLVYAKNLKIQNVQGNYFVQPMSFNKFLIFLQKYQTGLYMPMLSETYSNNIS
ncbi:MAG: EAL domain-containing protein [Pleomorphochaeta sp.]